MALVVEAVFMNAGSSVTKPVLVRSWAISTAFSPSVPITTGNSIAVPFTFSCARSATLSTSWGRALVLADHTIQLDAWASPPFRSAGRAARLSRHEGAPPLRRSTHDGPHRRRNAGVERPREKLPEAHA